MVLLDDDDTIVAIFGALLFILLIPLILPIAVLLWFGMLVAKSHHAPIVIEAKEEAEPILATATSRQPTRDDWANEPDPLDNVLGVEDIYAEEQQPLEAQPCHKCGLGQRLVDHDGTLLRRCSMCRA